MGSKEAGYVHLDAIEWIPERLQSGVVVKLKKAPFKIKLFKPAIPAEMTDHGVHRHLRGKCRSGLLRPISYGEIATPVKRGYVNLPDYWCYSCARNYFEDGKFYWYRLMAKATLELER